MSDLKYYYVVFMITRLDTQLTAACTVDFNGKFFEIGHLTLKMMKDLKQHVTILSWVEISKEEYDEYNAKLPEIRMCEIK